jgi:hypothetical protein
MFSEEKVKEHLKNYIVTFPRRSCGQSTLPLSLLRPVVNIFLEPLATSSLTTKRQILAELSVYNKGCCCCLYSAYLKTYSADNIGSAIREPVSCDIQRHTPSSGPHFTGLCTFSCSHLKLRQLSRQEIKPGSERP